MRHTRYLANGLIGELDQCLVEEDRLDVPDSLPADLDLFFRRKTFGRALCLVEHAGQPGRVEVTLVEQTFGGLDHRGDDSRLRHDAAHGAHRSVARRLRNLADLELE